MGNNVSLKAGTILYGQRNEYRIIRILGQGSFGITYLAAVQMPGVLGTIGTDKLVAIKELFLPTVNDRQTGLFVENTLQEKITHCQSMFIREAKILAEINHPNTIKVVELFEENSTVYYVMEYICGGSLDDRINQCCGLSEMECINYACQIGKTLEYLHAKDIFHLDLKPSNVMLHSKGQIVLIDFGISMLRHDNSEITEIAFGTPGYAPLEQMDHTQGISSAFAAAIDIYAFGATIFKMLTGHRPPNAAYMLNYGFPTHDLESIGISQNFIGIVRKCMEPMQKDRYATIREVVSAIMALPIDEIASAQSGFYKKRIEHSDYTCEVKLVPVTNVIKFPKSIKIKLWDNSKRGNSYELLLTDQQLPNATNEVTLWVKNKVIRKERLAAGIPDDVRKYIIKHGLLSTTHWENEEFTIPSDPYYGIEVLIEMTDDQGETFIRRVEHAHKHAHAFLLDVVTGLVFETSLAKLITHPYTLPTDTISISVGYDPARFLRFPLEYYTNDGYYHKLHAPSPETPSDVTVIDDFSLLIQDFNKLNIEVGEMNVFYEHALQRN